MGNIAFSGGAHAFPAASSRTSGVSPRRSRCPIQVRSTDGPGSPECRVGQGDLDDALPPPVGSDQGTPVEGGERAGRGKSRKCCPKFVAKMCS